MEVGKGSGGMRCQGMVGSYDAWGFLSFAAVLYGTRHPVNVLLLSLSLSSSRARRFFCFCFSFIAGILRLPNISLNDLSGISVLAFWPLPFPNSSRNAIPLRE